MMTWTLCSILSSVKELWKAVDNKLEPWHYRGWEGYILTYIQLAVFRFDSICSDYCSPFKKLRSMGHIVDKINYLAPVISNVDVDTSDPEQTYQYSFEFMERLFTPQHHPTISILNLFLKYHPSYNLTRIRTSSSYLLLAYKRLLATILTTLINLTQLK